MALNWSLLTEAATGDLDILSEGVIAHGRALAAGGNATPVACVVRDRDEVVAGGSGRTEFTRLFVSYLWVAPSLRRQGIGSRVLAELEAEAVRRGCTDALIETLSNEVASLYARLGYETVARVPRYVGQFTKHILIKPALVAAPQ
jgi:ribosomal protein S18 acetylase RimI-like enzyme